MMLHGDNQQVDGTDALVRRNRLTCTKFEQFPEFRGTRRTLLR